MSFNDIVEAQINWELENNTMKPKFLEKQEASSEHFGDEIITFWGKPLDYYLDISNKLIIIEKLISQSDFTQCQRCDGVGLPDCTDIYCSTYILHKIREVVDASNQ